MDRFTYSGGTIIEKTRSYLDEDHRVFLEDSFGQDGVLLRKRHCPENGPKGPCRASMDLMRSPVATDANAKT